jgi:O-antigen/teichoic acid export membrane protein
MNVSGATIGAIIFVFAYALLWAAYFVRIVKKYPGDRGIRFGFITLIVFLSTLAAYRLPQLTGILTQIFPLLAVTILVLVCATLFFLVQETIVDVRKSREKNDAGRKE